jgi:hypothetical protein
MEMKKTLLTTALVLGAALTQAQITTYVLEPPALEGALEFTWNENWGMSPDLNDPVNMIEEFAVFADDGTAADSLACNALVNGAAVTGKIAVLYRGTCEFGAKAMNAQNAGAIGVVIINNTGGAPIAMGAGAVGGTVTIPVVMISDVAGASLRDEINNGTVRMRIGSVQDLYQFNLNVDRSLALMPAQSAIPKWLATNDTELNAELGTWVKNFGSESQTGVTVTGVITQNGTEIYNNTSDPGDVPTGDSAFFALPIFSQPTYGGYYDITYTINSANTDGFPSDDSFNFNMLVDSIYGFARIDPATRLTINAAHYRPAGTPPPPNFTNCIHFQNPNASRVKVEGFYTSATKTGNASVDGEVLEGRLIEWGDNFADIDGATFDALATVATADYFYDEDLAGETVYIPFIEPYILEDDMRYLFCVFTPSDSVFLGYNETTDYTKTQEMLLQPISVINNDGAWFAAGFGSDVVSAIAVRMSPSVVGIEDLDRVEVTPYPNPANVEIRIPLPGQNGAAALQVFDMNGAKVAERRVSVASNGILTMDVTDLANGGYLFKMDFDNGKHASFRVVVTK